MPLTRERALALYNAINANEKKPNTTESLARDLFAQPPASYDELQSALIDVRKANLDRDSVVISLEGKPVRVYQSRPENIKIDVDDIFARGIDSARAVTEILNSADPKDDSTNNIGNLLQHQGNHQAREELIALVTHFQKNMQHHHQNGNLKHADQELRRFNGALSDLLVKHNVVANRGQGDKAINFVRDFLWKKDMCTANCVVENPPGDGSSKVLRYADPMTFGPAEFKQRGASTPLDFWTGDQPWLRKLKNAVGDKTHPWFDKFFNQHLNDLKKLSSTPMSRYTPNPANAFDCSDVWIKEGEEAEAEVVNMSHHLRTAVTEPLDAGETQSRQDVTDWNHLNMVNKGRLENELNNFMDKWGPLFADDNSIPFTMLHQTLIGDEVTFTPDQEKSKSSRIGGSVIDSKLEANAAVRDLLSKSVIIRDKATGKIEFLPKASYKESYPEGIPDSKQEVKIDLLETNDCINMWSIRARVRNNDVNDSRQLITNAVNIFKKVKPDTPTNKEEANAAKDAKDNLDTVIGFLNSADHSLFTPYKFRGAKVKEAIKELTAELKNNVGAFKHLPKYTRENLALSLNAAVELKCTVHETWGGALRRNITNFTRDYVRQVPILGHLVDWAIRGTMTVLALGAKVVAGLFTLPQTLSQLYKHRGDRQEIYKATYEGVLAETIGALQGGCMSSADRASEMAEQRVAQRKQFDAEGKILSYNDAANEKVDFYKEYGRSEAKHRFVQMATGTPVTSDFETRGFFQVGLVSAISETPEEQKLAKDFYPFRIGKFDHSTTCDAYKTASPAGMVEGEKPKAAVVTVAERLPVVKREDEQRPPVVVEPDQQQVAKPEDNSQHGLM